LDSTRLGLHQKGNLSGVGDLWFPTNSVGSRTPAKGLCHDFLPGRRVPWRLAHSGSQRQPLQSWRESTLLRSGLRCGHCGYTPWTLTLDGLSLCLPGKAWLPNLGVYSLPVGPKRPCGDYGIGVRLDATLNTSAKRGIIGGSQDTVAPNLG